MELESDAPTLPAENRSDDEVTTLAAILDYYRAVLLRKTWGLTPLQLGATLEPSPLTLSGLLLHMAFVEDHWFDHSFAGNGPQEPWASAPWSDDPDWEMTQGPQWTHDAIARAFDEACERSRSVVASAGSLDRYGAAPAAGDTNLRWIMVHMIEEYARHCGHADFIRQSIDGQVGD